MSTTARCPRPVSLEAWNEDFRTRRVPFLAGALVLSAWLAASSWARFATFTPAVLLGVDYVRSCWDRRGRATARR